MIETPQSFIVRQECDKATFQNGYRKPQGETAGWVAYGSTTAHGTIHLAASGPNGPWFLALDHAGVIQELNLSKLDMPGPGLARYAFDTLGALYKILPRIYRLAVSLPDAPLLAFQAKVKDLPKTTEAERLIVQRVGQDIFRAALDNYWGGACAITGITDRALLRASHIKRWADCKTDEERLDVHNGILLAAHYDAAFDAALITFAKDAKLLYSLHLSSDAVALLTPPAAIMFRLSDEHQRYLDHHRIRFAALNDAAKAEK
ncbi:HNH endonuclease [Rhodoblastus sp. 17X3]|uniref:HNH endonuclease n=1 Tax=Rhodoblastus sp. 17X3 TaxID=3047026 RepID=UPI0024B6D113|nr:HNH endonuclease [Rhodoblastus sp. 17X3]MDI9847638.1 HNH endonuclease [Rhodoblastus sp. 17X3]